MKHLLLMLREILNAPPKRADLICEFQREIWNTKECGESKEVFTILKELAYDLDFYVSDPESRQEEASYYGDERLVEEIETALKKIAAIEARTSH